MFASENWNLNPYSMRLHSSLQTVSHCGDGLFLTWTSLLHHTQVDRYMGSPLFLWLGVEGVRQGFNDRGQKPVVFKGYYPCYLSIVSYDHLTTHPLPPTLLKNSRHTRGDGYTVLLHFYYWAHNLAIIVSAPLLYHVLVCTHSVALAYPL